MLAATFGLLLATCTTSLAAAAPSWSFDPASWDFGVIIPGTGPTPPKTFTLTNSGDVELRAVFVSVGSGEGEFKLAGNTCGKLAPGASCTIGVIFDPSTPGQKDGQLQVSAQGGLAPPATAELAGAGAGPEVSVDQRSLQFPALPLGGVSGSKTVNVTNTGPVDLTLTWFAPAISLFAPAGYQHGFDTDVFKVSGGTCSAGSILPPSGSCTIDIQFAPTRPGHLVADLMISSNAADSPHLVILEGDGIAPAVELAPPFIEPRASIARRPARRTLKRQATFWLRGSPSAARFACKLDDQQYFRICSSPVRYPRLRTGRHRFLVRGVDPLGRWGAVTAFKWIITDGKAGTLSKR